MIPNPLIMAATVHPRLTYDRFRDVTSTPWNVDMHAVVLCMQTPRSPQSPELAIDILCAGM